ncbi:Uncharacterized protein GBIM_05557, partial [Gryllus bimaculatus]
KKSGWSAGPRLALLSRHCLRRRQAGLGPRLGRSPALQMVEEKARVVLSRAEFSTLAYYQEEYAGRQMTIEAFVAVLLELLNTPEKYTLLTELREVVLPEDRSRFDELVYRREAEGQRCRELRDLLDQREQERHGAPRRKGVPGSGDSSHNMLMANLHDLPGPPSTARSTTRPCKFPSRSKVAAPTNSLTNPRSSARQRGLGVGLGADGASCYRGSRNKNSEEIYIILDKINISKN